MTQDEPGPDETSECACTIWNADAYPHGWYLLGSTTAELCRGFIAKYVGRKIPATVGKVEWFNAKVDGLTLDQESVIANSSPNREAVTFFYLTEDEWVELEKRDEPATMEEIEEILNAPDRGDCEPATPRVWRSPRPNSWYVEGHYNDSDEDLELVKDHLHGNFDIVINDDLHDGVGRDMFWAAADDRLSAGIRIERVTERSLSQPITEIEFFNLDRAAALVAEPKTMPRTPLDTGPGVICEASYPEDPVEWKVESCEKCPLFEAMATEKRRGICHHDDEVQQVVTGQFNTVWYFCPLPRIPVVLVVGGGDE